MACANCLHDTTEIRSKTLHVEHGALPALLHQMIAQGSERCAIIAKFARHRHERFFRIGDELGQACVMKQAGCDASRKRVTDAGEQWAPGP